MAESEIYDFVSVATPDYDQILVLNPQGDAKEDGLKNQEIHLGDNNHEECVTLEAGSIFYIEFPVTMLTASDAGTVFDWYHDPVKANGMARSFKWTSPYDSHTYVVRFDCSLPRTRNRSWWGISSIRFRVVGKITDA